MGDVRWIPQFNMGHIEDYFFVAIGLDFFSFQDMRKHLQQTTTVPIQFSDLITYGLIAYIFNDTKWLCVCTLSSLTHNFNRFSNYLDYIQHTLLLQYWMFKVRWSTNQKTIGSETNRNQTKISKQWQECHVAF